MASTAGARLASWPLCRAAARPPPLAGASNRQPRACATAADLRGLSRPFACSSYAAGASGAPLARLLAPLVLRRYLVASRPSQSPGGAGPDTDARMRHRPQASLDVDVPLSPVQRIRAGLELQDTDVEPDVTAVRTALVMNAGIATAKAAVGVWTGSHTVLSEAAHSVGDTLQQGLLWYGIAKSKRKADSNHPYGYYRERYLWALVSASAVFSAGGMFAIMRGLHGIWHPEEVENLFAAFAVLLVSTALEGFSFMVALKALRATALRKGQTTWQAIRSGEDNTTAAVLLEDSAAIVGNIVAAFCIGMGLWTKQLFWDPAGGALIGCLLCCVAAFLIKKNRYFLLSPNIPQAVKDRAVAVLRRDPIVRGVFDVKGEQLGPRSMRFKAEVEFDGREIARRYILVRGHTAGLARALQEDPSEAALAAFLADFGEGLTDFQALEINRLEALLQSEMPDLTHIDLESHERTRSRR